MALSIQPPHQFGSGDNLTTMSTNTPTVMETKKRAYSRKDCGGDATNAETKKRAYRRKDCGGDTTNTSPAMKKTTDCGGDTNTSTVMEINKKRAYRRKKYLPHDLIAEQILTRLPVPTLLKSVLVSKLWFNSIHNDHKRLTYSHFLQSQKRPELLFSLLNVRDSPADYGCHFFKFTTGYGYMKHENLLELNQLRGGIAVVDLFEMVGYCNGLPCMAIVAKQSTAYIILDPNRNDLLYIFYPARVGKCISSFRIICHGFGFDPSANEFKLVSILRTRLREFNVLVFTLGTKSWRNVTSRSTPISGHDGRRILKIRAPTGSDKSAIFCTGSSSSSGCLAWKVIATLGGAGSNDIQHDNSIEMEMLLLFNLHDEKFHFIQLPAKEMTTDDQQNHLLVDYPHLMRFKGSPCIARIEKISGSGSNYHHRCRDDHQGSNSSSCCCCCCKIHLYILKDNVKQVWVKEETFDVRVNSTFEWLANAGYLAPDPCCFCFCTTTPTRIFSFSDQMVLYWFNGKCLQIYNLRSEKLQLVLPVTPIQKLILQAKMKEPRHISISATDDDIYSSNMDYQLHCHEENFLSLQTFIPEGVEGVVADEFSGSLLKRDRTCSAYVLIRRGSKVYYPIYMH